MPAQATVLDGRGLTVSAGFWNAHVHFIDPAFQSAASRPAAELTERMRAMLTRWGVVNAVDTGSREENTLALRRRIESGEIPGPRIMIMRGSFVPVGGIRSMCCPRACPSSPIPSAAALVEQLLGNPGIDGVELFTGSWATQTASS